MPVPESNKEACKYYIRSGLLNFSKLEFRSDFFEIKEASKIDLSQFSGMQFLNSHIMRFEIDLLKNMTSIAWRKLLARALT
jgi:hypothetical protein